MKKLLIVVAMLAMVLTGCGQKQETVTSDLQNILDKGTLVVGITEYAPMDYRDESGNWVGFDADLCQIVAEKLGVKVEFIVIDWDNKFLELSSNKIDCIWNGMTICDEVTLNTKCSDAYAKNSQVVVMKEENLNQVNSIEDLNNVSVAVENGGSAMSLLDENSVTGYLPVVDQATALMEVASGKSDACVIDITMANALTKAGSGYENLGYNLELSKEEYGIGFRKDSDLCDKVNELLVELTNDGTMQQLSDKYEVALVK